MDSLTTAYEQMVSAEPLIVAVNEGALTDALRSWEAFRVAYAEAEGTACYFTRAGGSWVHEPLRSMRWTVRQWADWFENVVWALELKPPEAYYLTDIRMKTGDLDALKASHPIVKAFSLGGPLDLCRYLSVFDERAPRPDLDQLLYLAPGFGIGSYFHVDGEGCQGSVHVSLFGPPGSCNLVHIYPKLTSLEVGIVTRECHMPTVTSLPHSYKNQLDDNRDSWNHAVQDRLSEVGIAPAATFRLGPMQCVVLPPERPHVFTKHVENAKWRTASPLLSAAGNASIVGPTASTLRYDLARLWQAELDCYDRKVAPYSMVELCVLCMVASDLREDSVGRAHLDGVGPFFRRFVTEQGQWLNYASSVVNLGGGRAEIRNERCCAACKRSLANVMLACGKRLYCGKCVIGKKGMVEAQIRFFSLAELQSMSSKLV